MIINEFLIHYCDKIILIMRQIRDIPRSVERLASQLPLKARQDQLDASLRAAHQTILLSLVNNGSPPSTTKLAKIVGEGNVSAAIQTLAKNDLVVMDKTSENLVGAYPVTTERTAHQITVNGHKIYAMCALDALAVAPMFNTKVQIESICHKTGTDVFIEMNGHRLVKALPSNDVKLGVRWQMPQGVAAHSMCLQMVFFVNEHIALDWQNGNSKEITIFSLEEGVEFGSLFFKPLMKSAIMNN